MFALQERVEPDASSVSPVGPDVRVTRPRRSYSVKVAWASDAGSFMTGRPTDYLMTHLADSDVWYLSVRLPAGARFAVGDAVLEVTPEPHLGCGKYIRRFWVEAMKLANTAEGRELRLRGMHAQVIEPATVRRGDPVHRLG